LIDQSNEESNAVNVSPESIIERTNERRKFLSSFGFPKICQKNEDEIFELRD